MRTRNSFVTLLLVVSLLLAPASLAGPSADAGFGWLSQVKAFFVDVLDFFSFDEALAPADQGTLDSQRNFICDDGEMGTNPEPNGCS